MRKVIDLYPWGVYHQGISNLNTKEIILMATQLKNYTVEGMTCGHCELSVKEEVSEISGITNVDASHETGQVTVTGENFTDEQVIAVIEEIGYTVKH